MSSLISLRATVLYGTLLLALLTGVSSLATLGAATVGRPGSAWGSGPSAAVLHRAVSLAYGLATEAPRRTLLFGSRVSRVRAVEKAAEQLAADRRAAAARRERLRATRSAIRDPRGAARAMAASDYGWGAGEFGCLNLLWTRESNWNRFATNASSGAYGIPQALPGTKMATSGSDWRTNPLTQITWGLSYIQRAYGTPCAAWSHSLGYGWY